MISISKPNTYCKNKFCTKGKDGARAFYYTCLYCIRTANYRSVACCLECYEEYAKQVLEARSKNRKVNLLPERTDMTESEVKNILDKPLEEISEMTVQELSDAGYSDDLPKLGFSGVADKINEEIKNNEDTGEKPKRTYKKRSDV